MNQTYVIEFAGDVVVRVRETGKYRTLKDGKETFKVIQLEAVPRFSGDVVVWPRVFWMVQDDWFLKEDYFTYEP